MNTAIGPPSPLQSRGSQQRHATSRLLAANAWLGIWLVISAFAWPHAQASFTNTWLVGALLAVFGLVARRFTLARSFCGVLALWLFLSSSLMLPRTTLTFWNNLLVAFAAMLVTFMASARARARRPTDT